MAKTLRVHDLAKELGVSSKVIVAKCEAEDVPGITNHMSTVKLGLAETIRQWFTEGETEDTGGTAVETAQKVDLKTVRKARPRHKAAPPAAKPADKPVAKTAPPAPPVEQAPAAPVEPPAPAVAQTPPAVEVQPVAPPPPVKVEAPASPPSTKLPGPIGRPNVPDRPSVIKPVGKQLEKPAQVKLKGPKVVRIEKPEPISPPRPRRPAGDTSGGGSQSPGDVPGITRTRGPARGRGAGAVEGGDESPAKPGKRRSLSTRRGRSADALPTGPTKFTQADMEELDARLRGATGFIKQRRRDLRKREGGVGPAQSAVVTGGKVEIQEPITIKALSAATGIKTADILKYLFKQGVMANINSAIGTEAAMEVALEYDIELDVKQQKSALEALEEQFKDRPQVDVRPRPPVVTVLGHVDHGKTSLLDKIRKADVAAHEAGGITQHVGAYRVTVSAGEKEKTVVFLDTPGHEAFTSMRSRGANMTDLVVLVVAADDGVMPQTVESINHARAADVPILVALNKIDTPQATEDNVRKIFGQLAEHGLNPTQWGGDTEVVRTSATKGTGISDLIDVLDYQAELLELKADYGGPASGTVIEAEIQSGRGSVARVLVEAGQIKVGDFIVIGRAFGRVRDMTDDRGRNITDAGPATPLEISGIDEVPDAGDKFYVTATLQEAERIANQFREHERQQQLASKTKVTLDNFAQAVAAGATRELRIVLKADVQGSMDVLRQSLEQLGNEEVSVRVLHAAVGGVTESDVLLADASDAIIIGFHVIATPAVREIADAREIDIRLYRVIYDVSDDVKKALEGMLEPEKKEEQIGEAEVREVFRVSKVGAVAGCLVVEGTMRKDGKARVVRDSVVVTDNRPIDSLRRIKDDVREVRSGLECGIKITGFDDIKTGDRIVCYKVVEVKRKLG
ncbi:MAG: translation initiation factor IF-2 [Phycisphaeraceae bacterium]|nr:translation initiation factor IF-2 [Phycisphaeraceae bacterium]